MDELIRINYDSERPTVNGRDLHDALGINNGKIPPFATKYCNIFDIAKKGIEDYVSFVHTEAL